MLLTSSVFEILLVTIQISTVKQKYNGSHICNFQFYSFYINKQVKLIVIIGYLIQYI